MLFRFPLYCFSRFSRSLALCSCQGAFAAIPEDDIVFQDFQDSQYLCCAGLAPAGELHPAGVWFASYPALECSPIRRFQLLSHSESTSGYEIRQDLMSP